MITELVPFERTGSFAKIFLDYVNGDPKLAHTYAFKPSLQGFESAIAHRKFPKKNREVLVEVLKEQYKDLDCALGVKSNIELLAGSNTFTVTTGHQLNIFTGPLFFVYKILTTINLTKELAKQYPDYNFVPIYWMASEDHDFAEINHVFVDGQKHTWETGQEGAVGRFNTDGLSELADAIGGRVNVFKEAYANSSTLADAVRSYATNLFQEYGLVVLDADDSRLKSLFKPVIKDDLLNHEAYQSVSKRSQQLIDNGYKPQINPREINLFYLQDGLRKRIVRSGDRFQVIDSEINFSQKEILELVESNPEFFSPNVILRPLYQETILPNLGYIGGPAELAYWLQLKELFDQFRVDFPVLMPRNFGLYLPKNTQRKIEKLQLSSEHLFQELDSLKQTYVHESLNGEMDLSMQKEEIKKAYLQVAKLASDVDNSLESYVNAEAQKAHKSLDNIVSKMVKAEKRKREDEMRKLTEINELIFPNGTLQERRENILSINNPEFIEEVAAITNPFDLKFNIYKE
jgi:bacillithiol biosynthesis cysteine-adding enzyme BshC